MPFCHFASIGSTAGVSGTLYIAIDILSSYTCGKIRNERDVRCPGCESVTFEFFLTIPNNFRKVFRKSTHSEAIYGLLKFPARSTSHFSDPTDGERNFSNFFIYGPMDQKWRTFCPRRRQKTKSTYSEAIYESISPHWKSITWSIDYFLTPIPARRRYARRIPAPTNALEGAPSKRVSPK